MITMKDIAKEANVSTATVSRVLNNSNLVAEKRKKQVEDAVKRLNYSPNALARELVTRNTNTIGILISDIANIYFPTIISTLTNELEERGYNIFLGITGGVVEKEISYLSTMMKKRVEGIILLGSRILGSESNGRLIDLSERLPIVIMDYAPNYDIYSVRTDEMSGAYSAVEYLIKMGHKKIAFLNGKGNYTTFFYKQAGFEKAMMDHNIGIQSQYCINIDPHYSGGFNGTNVLLDLSDRPTAIFTAGDQIAIGAYHAIQARGLQIPDDVSVIGYSGTKISEHIYPPLTTVDQYPEETGRCAAKLIVDVLNKKEIPNKQVVLQPQIIIRNSCKTI